MRFARPIRSVPESMPIPRLLREMQVTHRHMAIVIDEYGTAVGIVTLENVIDNTAPLEEMIENQPS